MQGAIIYNIYNCQSETGRVQIFASQKAITRLAKLAIISKRCQYGKESRMLRQSRKNVARSEFPAAASNTLHIRISKSSIAAVLLNRKQNSCINGNHLINPIRNESKRGDIRCLEKQVRCPCRV